jgi:hypothetical protein
MLTRISFLLIVLPRIPWHEGLLSLGLRRLALQIIVQPGKQKPRINAMNHRSLLKAPSL